MAFAYIIPYCVSKSPFKLFVSITLLPPFIIQIFWLCVSLLQYLFPYPFSCPNDSDVDVSEGSLKINFERSMCTSKGDSEEGFKESSAPRDLSQFMIQYDNSILIAQT